MLDSTIVRAHQQAATGRKKRGSEDAALVHSRGGLSTKIHVLADEDGLPLEFRITAGQAGEYASAAELLKDQRAEAVIADRGYDADVLIAHPEASEQRPLSRPSPIENSSALMIANSTNTATHRTMLQRTQTLPPLRHTILQNHTGIPILHCPRMRMAQT
jgi:IS5 family transposase